MKPMMTRIRTKIFNGLDSNVTQVKMKSKNVTSSSRPTQTSARTFGMAGKKNPGIILKPAC